MKTSTDDAAGEAINVERRFVLWLFVLAAVVLLSIQQGSITVSDGSHMYQVTRSLVERRSVSVPAASGDATGRHGEHYSKYGIGLSLVAVVPYALAIPVTKISGYADVVETAAASSVVPMISAALLAMLYLLARRLGAGVRPALLVAVGALLGTFFGPYAKDYFAEPLTALGITIAVERLLAKKPMAAGAGLGMAILARPQSILLMLLFGWVCLRCCGVSGLVRLLPGLLASLAVTVGYNLVRFGQLTEFGYGPQEGFTTPLWRGGAGLLFDSQKSVLLFAPLILLVPIALAELWKRNEDAALLLLGNFLVTFVLTATWSSWPGGWSWGPRLLLPGLLPLFAAVGPWLRAPRRLQVCGVLVVAGFFVSAPALFVPTQIQQLDRPLPRTGPGFMRQYRLAPQVTRYTIQHLYEAAPSGLGSHRHYLSIWQVGLARTMGRKGLALACAGTLVLLGLATFAAARCRQWFACCIGVSGPYPAGG